MKLFASNTSTTKRTGCCNRTKQKQTMVEITIHQEETDISHIFVTFLKYLQKSMCGHCCALLLLFKNHNQE
jgi:hypothetical protein